MVKPHRQIKTEQSAKVLEVFVRDNPYIPTVPTIRQMEFLALNDLEALFGGQAGGGKMITYNTIIPTPLGFRSFGSIKPGDFVFDDKGKPTLVLAESETLTVNGYRFTFDDGSEVVSNDDHLWKTFNDLERNQLREARAKRPSRSTGEKPWLSERESLPNGTIRTTKEIVNTLTKGKNKRANHAIKVCEPLQFSHKDLPIDPYVLGAWLGDGFSACGEDDEVFDECSKYYKILWDRRDNPNNPKFRICRFDGLMKDLRSLNLIDNKHIPDKYLFSSEEQRTALLQGFLDTDGSVSKSSIEFSQKHFHLVEQVAWLVRSLGMKCTIRYKEAKSARIKFSANRILFRIKRKADAQLISTRQTNKFRYIKKAERVYNQKMKCIRVANPDGMFLITKNCIPTHNSEALLMAALMFVILPNYHAILFRRTFTDLNLPEALMHRSQEWLSNTDAHWNGTNYRWTFPTGSTLSFGYLNSANDKMRYQSSAFGFIGFDELTQFEKAPYRYLFSRLRKGVNDYFPLRQRGATNPGGIGHNWVYNRFVATNERPFIRSALTDNPYIDRDEYERSLSQLSDIDKKHLAEGLWITDMTSKPFVMDYWNGKNRYVWGDYFQPLFRILSYDTALEVKKVNDYSALAVIDLMPDYSVRLRFIRQEKLAFPQLVSRIESDYKKFNLEAPVSYILIEGKASGKPAIQTLRAGVNVDIAQKIVEINPKGSKLERASQSGIWCKRNMVHFPAVMSQEQAEFEQELYSFPDVSHDDRTDAFNQGVIYLENYISTGWNTKKIRETRAKEDRVSKALKEAKKAQRGY